MKTLPLIGICLLGLVTLAQAQPDPSERGLRRQDAEGTRKPVLRFVVPTPRFQLALRSDARTDLGMSDDQARSVVTATMKVRKEDWMRSGDPEGAYRRWQLNMDDAMMRELRPDQRKRMDQIFMQVNGYIALTEFEIAKAVGLDDGQRASIKAMMNAANRKLREDYQAALKSPDGGTNPSDPINMAREISTKIGEMLSEGQKATFKDLGGPEFKQTSRGVPGSRRDE